MFLQHKIFQGLVISFLKEDILSRMLKNHRILHNQCNKEKEIQDNL